MFIKECLLFIFFGSLLTTASASLTIIDKGVMPLEKYSVAIQFYIDVENKDHARVCKFHTRLRKCLLDSCKENCDVFIDSSEIVDEIKYKDRKTLIYVFPTLFLHDLLGVCDITLTYRCPDRKKRLIIDIPFDTRVDGESTSLLQNYISDDKKYTCETIDQNSLNDCLPVDCDIKYCGARPFYNSDIKRCVEAATCIDDPKRVLPNTVYDPKINICTDYLPLTIQNIYAISTGLGTVTESTKDKDVLVKLKSNCSTISQNVYLLRDLLYGKLCPCDGGTEIDYGDGCKNAVFNIVICVISVCAVLLSIVCCINTTVWVHKQWMNGTVKEFLLKLRRKLVMRKDENNTYHKTGEVRNALLREVIVKDIPLELRDSVVSICDRMNREVWKKKRYRDSEFGSHISLERAATGPLKHSETNNGYDNN